MAVDAGHDVEVKPPITRAVARGDLPAVRRIVEAASSISHDEKIKTVNRARKWTEYNVAYATEEDPSGAAEWFDVTPLTTAVMRGHDAIVEYLLEQGADPTLKGCPKDDIELPNDDNEPLSNIPNFHMNAFDAALRLTRKIRCCRRTRDLLMMVKPYWKRCVYSGTSAQRHKRTIFSNAPLNMSWILDALKEVPPLESYPFKAKDFDEDFVHSGDWRKRKREDADIQSNVGNMAGLPQQIDTNATNMTVEEVEQMQQQSRRCFSCSELKPVASFNKNEKRKGVEGRCISCVATNPSLDIIICPVCKTPRVNGGNDGGCLSCSVRVSGQPKKPLPPQLVKKESD